MFINILLPYKEKFSKNKASSVSLTVANNLQFSKYKKHIRVFGHNVKDPMYKRNFIGISDSWNFLKSRNINLAVQMCKLIKRMKIQKSIIEIHNRPYLTKLVKSKLHNHSINLFLHNNPLDMKGSKTIKERLVLLDCVDNIYCVSNFVKEKFLIGINKNQKKVKVVYNGVKRRVKSEPLKKNNVIFVGRIVPEKGVDLFVKAIKLIYKDFLNWEFKLIGSKKLGSNSIDKFSKQILCDFDKIGKRTSITGYVNQDQLNNIMKKSSIIIIPSTWEEPFGLVAAEAMSYGIAIIASNSGGLKEIIDNNGILIDNINEFKIAKELSNLMSNDILLKKYQKLSWNNFSFTSDVSSKKLDYFRSLILNS